MSVIYAVHVKPGAKKSEVMGFDKDHTLRVEVKASPHDGRANFELVKLLSKHFGRQVRIKSGMTGKKKIVELV
jgi:uncharacterized protein (TIGR00251 family)